MDNNEQGAFIDAIADGLDAIARAAVKFASHAPHLGLWKLDRTIPGPVARRQHTEVWTVNVVCAMPQGTDPAHVRAAGAVCQRLRVELTTLRTLSPMVRHDDDVSILDGAGNVAGVTPFRNLPESLQLDLVNALNAKRARDQVSVTTG